MVSKVADCARNFTEIGLPWEGFPRNCIKAAFSKDIDGRLRPKYQNVIQMSPQLFIFVEVCTVDTVTNLSNIPEQTLTYKH